MDGKRRRADGTAHAAHSDDRQDPPGDRHTRGPALRGVAHDRRQPHEGGQHRGGRAGPDRRHHQRRPAGDLRHHRGTRLGGDRSQRRGRAAGPAGRPRHRHHLRTVRRRRDRRAPALCRPRGRAQPAGARGRRPGAARPRRGRPAQRPALLGALHRPESTTSAWWRRPVGTVYLATLVMSIGKGAWFTAWVMFLTRSVGLSPAQFGIGVTAAGVIGLFVGAPFGYLPDRIGAREMIVVLGIVQGLALFSFAFLDDFLAIMVSTCVLTAGERSTPGIRIALLSGLTTGRERLTAIATTHVMTQAGIAVGAIGGAVVLVLDARPGYLGLVTFCGTVSALAALLLLRVPHVDSLRDKKGKSRGLVLRRPPS